MKRVGNLAGASPATTLVNAARDEPDGLSSILEEKEREKVVIPVVLTQEPEGEKPKLPLFLEGRTWVDFRKKDPDPMKQLVWGITGERFFLID